MGSDGFLWVLMASCGDPGVSGGVLVVSGVFWWVLGTLQEGRGGSRLPAPGLDSNRALKNKFKKITFGF